MRRAYDLAYWDVAKIKDALAHARSFRAGEVVCVRMHTLDYDDLRSTAVDVLNTRAGDLNVGLMGKIFEVAVYATRSHAQGVASFFGPEDLPLSHVVNPRRWSVRPAGGLWSDHPPCDHSLSFHGGPLSSCTEGLCVSVQAIGS